jgi:Flp pilus assembly CpaE family ATPase
MRAGIRDVVDMTQAPTSSAKPWSALWPGPRTSGRRPRPRRSTAGRGSVAAHHLGVLVEGRSGKTFPTTNLATAIAQVTGEDVAVVDLDVDMGDVFTPTSAASLRVDRRPDGAR